MYKDPFQTETSPSPQNRVYIQTETSTSPQNGVYSCLLLEHWTGYSRTKL